MDVVGSYLRLNQDSALFASFQRYYTSFFPALAGVSRTTFVRQAANMWAAKERVWCWLHDGVITSGLTTSIIDSAPLPICRFARVPWRVQFRGMASYGKDHVDRQTFYGLCLHAQIDWTGLITRAFLAPANEADGEIAPMLLKGTTDVVLGGHHYLASGSASIFALQRHRVARSVLQSAFS